MTDFDRAVLQWLDTSSITDRARNVTLGRTHVGIQSYAELIRGDDSTAAIPVDAIRLDIGLKDIVARAQRRLEDGQPMQLGELPAPPPAPQTLMSARSSNTTGPNLRGGGSASAAANKQLSKSPSVENANNGSSRGNSQQQQQRYVASGVSRNNTNSSNVHGGGAVPLSARSGTLADPRSARGEPKRPTGVPPLKLQQKPRK